MSQPNITPFTIDNTNILYYNNKDLKILKPHFFYGFQSDPKHIIERKNIPESDYVFTCFNKKKGWSIYDNTCKRAQLLIKKSWVDKFFFNQNDILSNHILSNDNQEDDEEKNQNIQQSIDLAPNILDLDDDEKFKDIDGNIIEIEILGEKNCNKIYFKVNDIITGFEMHSLYNVLLRTDKGYKRNIHYKNFYRELLCQQTGRITIKKQLYLTYYGLLKVLFNSKNRQNFFLKNINILTKWLDNLINNKYYNNYILEKVSNDLSGVVYICSSPLVNAVKIGYWTGNITSLQSRYKMTYGKDVFLICKNVENAHDIEKQIHREFKQFNISGELFQKDNIQLYIDYFNDYIIEYENNDNEFRQEYNSIDKMAFIEEKEIEKNNIIGTLEMSHANDLLEKEITDLKNELLLKDCKIESLKKDNEILQKNMDYNIIQNKYELLLKQNELDSFKRESLIRERIVLNNL